jgi:hypothetical protein
MNCAAFALDDPQSYVAFTVECGSMFAGANADCRRHAWVSCGKPWFLAQMQDNIWPVPAPVTLRNRVGLVGVEVSEQSVAVWALSPQCRFRPWNIHPGVNCSARLLRSAFSILTMVRRLLLLAKACSSAGCMNGLYDDWRRNGGARNATGQCSNRLGKTGVDLLCQKFCRLTLVHLMGPEEANLSLSCRPDCSWRSGWALQPVAAASRALRVCVAVLHKSSLGSLEIIKLHVFLPINQCSR